MPREMKDSMVEWIKEIPSTWFYKPIKRLLLSRVGGSWGNEIIDEESGTICLRIADFEYSKGIFKNASIDELTKRKYSQIQIKKLQLQKGDILIEKSGGGEKTPVGRTVIFDKDYVALFANFMDRLRFNNNIVLPCFAEYWMRAWYGSKSSPYYINQTIGIQNINLNLMLAREYMYYPTIYEQSVIIAFLDSECAEIDALYADIEEQIKTLEEYKKSVITEAVTKGLNPEAEMKDSGIEWVGNIPFNWQIEKGKYCLKYLQKPTKPDDDVITCFRDGEVTLRKNRREDGFTVSLQEIGYQGIDKGDLIVHGMDGFAGAIGISDSRGKASPVLNVLDTKHNKRYIMYYLRNMAYNGVFIALATGIRVRTCDTNWGKLRELPYILPPKDEQDHIVEYIDNRLLKVNSIINEKQKQLELLDEYKKSIIYEYVTGKKEVV